MTLLQTEKDAIKTLAAYYEACDGICIDCEFKVRAGHCVPSDNHYLEKRMRQ